LGEYLEAQSLLSSGLAPDLFLVESAPGDPGRTLERLQVFQGVPKSRICLILAIDERKLREDALGFGIEHFLDKPATRSAIQSTIYKMRHSLVYGAAAGIASHAPQAVARTTAIPTDNPARFHLEELGGDRFFLAASPKMLEIYRQVKLIADVNVPLLILGESGTGKEVIAHLIHKLSRRSHERFLKVNCAALPSELMESELFGHRQGAFTGALRDRLGMVEKANYGTLLLDEIGEMSVQMQAKLLHVIEDGQFTRLGGQESTKVDVRILAATNIDMESALAEKTFREDLYYRLNAFTIRVPPLRERREEIPFLIEETIRRMPPESKKWSESRLCSRLIDAALRYDWRGNLRELRNFVTRAIIMGDQDGAVRELETKIAMSERGGQDRLRGAQLHHPPMRSLVRDVKNRTEAQLIQEALELSGWNRRRAAEFLNISYRGLLYKIHQHRLMPRPLIDPDEAAPRRYFAAGEGVQGK
jgi:two-component system response regulator AtoC